MTRVFFASWLARGRAARTTKQTKPTQTPIGGVDDKINKPRPQPELAGLRGRLPWPRADRVQGRDRAGDALRRLRGRAGRVAQGPPQHGRGRRVRRRRLRDHLPGAPRASFSPLSLVRSSRSCPPLPVRWRAPRWLPRPGNPISLLCVVVVRAPSRFDRASTSSSRACRASTRPSTRRPWTARRSCTPRAASARFTRCGVDLGPRVALCRSFVRSGGGVERSLSRPAGGTLVGSRPARSHDRAALFAAAAAAFLPLPRRPLSRATLTRLNLLSPSDARDDDGRAADGRRRAPPGL